MAYQKIINLLHNGNLQPSRFKTRNWVKINDIYRTQKILSSRLQC